MYISATLPERLVGTIEVNACQPKVWQRAKQACAAYSLLQLRKACSQHEGGFSASTEPEEGSLLQTEWVFSFFKLAIKSTEILAFMC